MPSDATVPAPKICSICGQDCSGRPRTKDKRGRYYCRACYERAKARLAVRKGGEGAGSAAAGGAADPAVGVVFSSEGAENPQAVTDFIMLESSAPVLRSQGGACPHCAQPMSIGWIRCDHCGYDKRTGEVFKAGVGTADRVEKTSILGDAAKAAGSFVLGCIVSGIGALIGAVVWCVIAVVTQYESGFVAWGVGMLAGLGMVIGHHEKTRLAGIVAAGLAVAGIVVGKVAIFFVVLYSMITGHASSLETEKAFLIIAMGNEALDEAGIVDKEQRRQQWPTVRTTAEKQLEKKNEAEIRALANEYREKFRAKARAESLDEGEEDHEDSAAASQPAAKRVVADAGKAVPAGPVLSQDDEEPSFGAALGLFLKEAFGPMDILFIGLAVISAFRIAGGSIRE